MSFLREDELVFLMNSNLRLGEHMPHILRLGTGKVQGD